MKRLRWIGFVVVIGLSAGLGRAQTQLETDELTLKGSKMPTDTKGLIEFFETRSLKEGDEKNLQELVRQLGSDVYRIREPAYKALVIKGPKALPFLKSALSNTTLEVKLRAELCIKDIEKTMQAEPISAAARVLATRKAPQAAEVLFNFLPSISNDPLLEEELLSAVGRLTIPTGKVDPLILMALKDPAPHRRAAAVYLVGRRADVEYREQLRQMLTDADPQVAQRVSQGLIGKRPAQVLQEAFNADENLLKSQKVDLTDAGVLGFFRKRTLGDKEQQRLRTLVRDLGKGTYALRVQATKELLKEGTPALAFLQQVEFDADVELSRRARFCLDEIRRTNTTDVPMAAAHWLARPQPNKDASPAETIRVLLAYAPFADDDAVEEELLTSLTLLSLREPKIVPELIDALKDPMPQRRSAAAYVLGHVGTKDQVARVQPLLNDLHPVVRLRAAQGMLAARDRSALPTLAQLVQRVPAPYLNRIEDTLHRLAADKGPSEAIVATSADSRQKAGKAWEKWLETNQNNVDLTSLNDRAAYLGLITICEYDNQVGNINGQIWETNRSNQKRWSFAGVLGAMDAHTLPNGRVLVAENNANRVSERDSKGNIVWEYRVPNNPICCQRLPNGNTFIASYNMVMEVTPGKTEVYRYTPGPQFYIFSAHKARNGNIVAITAQGQIIEMDSKNGQQINTVPANTLGNWCSVELQPNGNYLVASMSTNNVRELDRKGTEVWSKPFASAFRATRLPNGNVLVAGMNTREVAEMDRAGNIRWRTNTTGRPWSVHYR